MALTAAGLKTAIKAQMDSTYGAATEPDSRDAFAEAMAAAIINYITANAVVTVTVVGGSSSGVHTGTVG